MQLCRPVPLNMVRRIPLRCSLHLCNKLITVGVEDDLAELHRHAMAVCGHALHAHHWRALVEAEQPNFSAPLNCQSTNRRCSMLTALKSINLDMAAIGLHSAWFAPPQCGSCGNVTACKGKQQRHQTGIGRRESLVCLGASNNTVRPACIDRIGR